MVELWAEAALLNELVRLLNVWEAVCVYYLEQIDSNPYLRPELIQ